MDEVASQIQLVVKSYAIYYSSKNHCESYPDFFIQDVL